MPPKRKGKKKKKLQESTVEKMTVGKESIEKENSKEKEKFTICPESVQKVTTRPGSTVKMNKRPNSIKKNNRLAKKKKLKKNLQEESVENTPVPRKIKFVRFGKRPQEESTEKNEMPPKKKVKFNSEGHLKMTFRKESNEIATIVQHSVVKPVSILKKSFGLKKNVAFKADLTRVKVLEEETPAKPHRDTIGMHLIALRTFYRNLVHYRSRKARRRCLRPKLPKYPEDYPTSGYLFSLRVKRAKDEPRPQLEFKRRIKKAKVTQSRTQAIRKILQHVGFSDEEENFAVVHHLSYVADIFLKSITERIHFHKNSDAFHRDKDLWNSLETTLQELGFQGIRGIAKFFYEEFVQTTETLHNKCTDMFEEVKTKDRVDRLERKRRREAKRGWSIQSINNNIAVSEDMEIA